MVGVDPCGYQSRPLLFWAVVAEMRVHLTHSMAAVALSSEHQVVRPGSMALLNWESNQKSMAPPRTHISIPYFCSHPASTCPAPWGSYQPAQAARTCLLRAWVPWTSPLQCPGECCCQHGRRAGSICLGRRQGWGSTSADWLKMLWSLTLRHKRWCFALNFHLATKTLVPKLE